MPPGLPLSGRRRRVAAPALGHDAAQPRRSLHGSRGADEARRHGGAGAGRRRRAHRAVSRPSSPQTNRGWGTRLVPQLDETLGYYRPALSVLLGAVVVLLTIACINVASLLLTRALSREREVAVRSRARRHAAPAGAAAPGRGPDPGRRRRRARPGAHRRRRCRCCCTTRPVSIPRLADAAVDVRTVGVGAGGHRRRDAVLRAGAGAGLAQASPHHRVEDRGAGQLARRAPPLLGAGRRRAGAGLRAAGRVGAAGAHGAADDRDAHRRGRRRRGHDAHPGASGARATRPQSSPAGARWPRSTTAILDAVRREPGVQAAGATNFLPFEVGWREPVPDRRRPAAAAP